MNGTTFAECPRCGSPWEAGFAAKAAGLSFVAAEKFTNFAFVDEDLSHAGLRKILPSKAEYFRSFLCRGCELYLVDFSHVLDRKDAEEEAGNQATHV